MDTKLALQEFTCFDIFGYWLPGIVLVGGTLVIFGPGPLAKPLEGYGSTARWAAFLLVSYLAGHFAQAVDNGAARVFGRQIRPAPEKLWPDLEKKGNGATVKIWRRLFGRPEGGQDTVRVVNETLSLLGYKTDSADKFGICDSHVQRHGCFPHRDIYLYRTAFYRTMTIAYAILLIELAVAIGTRSTALPAIWHWIAIGLLLLLGIASTTRAGRLGGLLSRGVYVSFCECMLSSRHDRQWRDHAEK